MFLYIYTYILLCIYTYDLYIICIILYFYRSCSVVSRSMPGRIIDTYRHICQMLALAVMCVEHHHGCLGHSAD